VQKLLKEKEAFSFDWKRSLLALVISIIADTLDFIGEPILSFPLIGDIPNAFVTGLLFIITRNKRSAAINLIKFIPVIGDFIPTYTISTLMWIHKEARKSKSTEYII
jgi:predicted membrane protein